MNDHGIRDELVIAREEGAVLLEFAVPAECDFFDGHFPDFKLLPAVGQFEIATRFATKYLGTTRTVTKIRRVKFSAPIRPNSRVRLSLSFKREKGSVTFTFHDAADEGKIYSSGSFFSEAQS